jgi:hypothetical protein
MNSRSFLLCAATACLMAMPAMAQDMSMMMMGPLGSSDANKDGAITKDEWSASFDSMDADKNGTISREEMLAHMKAQAEQMKAMYADKIKSAQAMRAQMGKTPCGDAADAAPQ